MAHRLKVFCKKEGARRDCRLKSNHKEVVYNSEKEHTAGLHCRLEPAQLTRYVKLHRGTQKSHFKAWSTGNNQFRSGLPVYGQGMG